jgi:geranylgeranylglycerol-phosphate geranylgeranyltransferase
MTTRKVRALFRLFRFDLSFSAGMCVLLGELLALGHVPSINLMLSGFLSVFFIAAATLILNDVFDLETDRINAPDRPLPSGAVSRGEVIMLSIFVALAGLLCAFLISKAMFVVVLAVWCIGFLYNGKFKESGLPGNLLVCTSVGMTFITGGIAVGRPLEPTVWFMGILALLIDLGEEIAADALDVEGDRKTGSRSLAVVYDPQIAMRIAVAVFAFLIVFTAVPFVTGILPLKYLPPIALLDGMVLYAMFHLPRPELPRRIRYIKMIYLSGLASVLLFMVMRLVIA